VPKPVVIQTQGLTRCFGSLTAVDCLDIEVYGGEVFGFLGHNGAGKTTTIRLLNGVLGPTRGSIRVLGLDPDTEGSALRRRTGVLTELPSLDDRLTAEETLAIYGELYGVSPDDLATRIPELLDEFGLGDRAGELTGGYSKGMRQRLALARTLIHDPELLFLDEPTASLDPVGQRDVHELVLRLSRGSGRTIFLCTHDLVEAQKLCDRVAVMEHGRLVALGTPASLARELQQGVRLEIVTASPLPDDVLRGVLLQPEAQQVAWSEADHVATMWLPTREAVPDLVAALVSAGTRVYEVRSVEPSLEDVYFAIHDRSALVT
jgi:ABC-2 type transport system ATP-binding protein